MSVEDRYFEGLFRGNNDPWGFRQRWYEQRKRLVTLAALPRPHYRAIFEPGCANAELSAALAERCDRLLCCDTSAAAANLARTRLSLFDQAGVRHGRLPGDWPEEKFELHLPRLVLHQEADFLLEVWSREPRSVAALEGLR